MICGIVTRRRLLGRHRIKALGRALLPVRLINRRN
jgi:hypothetical protein